MKKLLLVMLVVVLVTSTLSCKKGSTEDPKGQIEKKLEEKSNERQPKKIFETSFYTDNISNIVLGYNETYNSEALNFKIKNISKGIEKLELNSIDVNGENKSVVIAKEKSNIFEFPAEGSFMVLIPEDEKEISIKLFDNRENKIFEKKLTYPLMLTFKVEEKITKTYYLQEFIIDKQGKILYENLKIINYEKSLIS